jgi:hypothetical protein
MASRELRRIKQRVKLLLETILPAALFHRIQATRARRAELEFLASQGLLDEVKRHVEKHGNVVQSGPFSGLTYPPEAAISRWSAPKLLGTYEMELHPVLSTISTRKYDCAIDIGSAEGYYAVGLARMLRIPVFAYDPAPEERAYSARMAECNDVAGLVHLADLFTVETMRRFAGQRALVVCDCEGFEERLFQPETVELTRNWDIIIELHGTADAILPALAWPHAVTVIQPDERSNSAQNEHRGSKQRFLWCDSQA